MVAESDHWRQGFGSPTPSSSSIEDDGPERRPSLSRDAQLARDLDLFSRYDAIDFKQNPFTLAKLAATRQRSGSSGNNSQERNGTAWTEGGGEGKDVSRAPVTVRSSARTATSERVDGEGAKRQPGSSIPVANPDPGGRNHSTLQATQRAKNAPQAGPHKEHKDVTPSEPVPKKKWQKSSGWYDGTGKPVPVYEPKTSLLEAVDEVVKGTSDRIRSKNASLYKKNAGGEITSATTMTKKTAKKTNGGTGAKSKKNQDRADNGKIVFTRIPAGAGPTSQFPIVKGLLKQRELPTKKARNNVLTPAAFNSSSDSVVPLSSLDIQALVGGIAEGARKEVEARQKAAGNDKLPPLLTKTAGRGLRDPVDGVGQPDSDTFHRDAANCTVSDDEQVYSSPPNRLQQQAKKAVLAAMTKQRARQYDQEMDDMSHNTPRNTEELAEKYNNILSRTQRETDHILETRIQQAGTTSHHRGISSSSSLVPSLVHSFGTATTQTVVTPREKNDTPSTMTHVSLKEIETNTSSSDQAYSSPLGNYAKVTRYLAPGDLIVNPAPVRLPRIGRENVEFLEDMADKDSWRDQSGAKHGASVCVIRAPAADGNLEHGARIARPTQGQYGRPPAFQPYTVSHMKRDRSSFTHGNTNSDWSTLPTPSKKTRHDQLHLPVIKTTPAFRLSSKYFQSKPAPAPAPTTARTKLFVPSPPKSSGSADHASYSRSSTGQKGGFHEQVLRAVGMSDFPATRLDKSNDGHRLSSLPSHASDHPRSQPQEDWRDQWRRASALSAKYTLTKPSPESLDTFDL